MKRENKKYLDWVRGRSCAICLHPAPSEAHHIKGDFNLSGAGLKAPDFFSMPLCKGCHQQLHSANPGWRDAQREALIRTIISAYEQGMIVVD